MVGEEVRKWLFLQPILLTIVNKSEETSTWIPAYEMRE
jgi:hypothetical protein